MYRRVDEDVRLFYICGQCGDKQYYQQEEEPPEPCPDCGYYGKAREKYDVPAEIPIDLNRY